LITGTAGFVGSHVLESVLRKTDWDVICVDSLKSWQNGNIESTMQAMSDLRKQGRGISHMTHDLAIPFRAQQIDFIGYPDYILNIASMSQVEASINDPVGFMHNNVQLMSNMLDLARQVKPKRFIHMSTDEVYGRGLPCAPTDYQPSSPYAASKAAQEVLSLSYSRTFKVPVSIVNSANMFGQRQSELAFIPKIVRWLHEGKVIPVHYYGDLPGNRSYTYVKNVSDHIVSLCREDTERKSDLFQFPQRITLPGQERIANDELVKRIAKLAGMEPRIMAVDGEAHRPGHDPMYHDLIPNQDWWPPYTFNDGLKNTVEWLVSKL
jgi:dTDP-glucose 4,6-dehydratase